MKLDCLEDLFVLALGLASKSLRQLVLVLQDLVGGFD